MSGGPGSTSRLIIKALRDIGRPASTDEIHALVAIGKPGIRRKAVACTIWNMYVSPALFGVERVAKGRYGLVATPTEPKPAPSAT